MSLWTVGLVVLVVALLLPLLIVLLDSPWLRRAPPTPALPPEAVAPPSQPTAGDLSNRLLTLEDEMDELTRAVRDLRDDVQDLQRALEQGDPTTTPRRADRPD